MSAPVYVTFRHMAPRPALEQYAREQVERLDRLYDGIVDCRVRLEPRDTALRVVIEMTVPGDRLVSAHQSDPDSMPADADRPADPESQWRHTLHEGFAAARRVLQDYVTRRRTRTRRTPSVAQR
jgi:hypothetical protein